MTTINQFMWGFQQVFRSGLERTAQQVFAKVGFGVGPRAYLVGFAVRDDLPHSVCFEPQSEELALLDLVQILTRSDEIFENDPESRIFHSHAPLHDRRQRHLRDASRARALHEALESSVPGQGRTFRVGSSAVIEGSYAVHPVLAFPSARWKAKPTLSSKIRDRIPLLPSFQDSLAAQLLAKATTVMRTQEAPEGFGLLSGGPTVDEIIREAAQSFTRSIAVLAGYPYGSELHSALDAVAAQPYEGRSSIGRVLLARSNHPEVDTTLSFVEPIPIGSTRRFRKALEMTDDTLSLICDGAQLTGLGILRNVADVSVSKAEHTPRDKFDEFDSRETHFSFEVMGRGEWQLTHRGTHMLRVINSKAEFPDPPLSRERFQDVARRLFPDTTKTDLDALWELASAAAEAEHGTILVIHRDAAAESVRLAPQAQQVTPTVLSAAVLSAVTSIDGAVLVDPSARCHGVGVILDGVATGEGDPGRGARFNSALRYHRSVGNDALIVIVSEDGMINLVPLLNRRVRVEEVERPVAAIEDAASVLDAEAFHRAWDHLEALSFYLTGEQCDRINAARELLEEARARGHHDPEPGLGFITDVTWIRFKPAPGMNDSYFIDNS
ncbi:diadenylate cyclase [Paeniglutamicibacter sp. ORCA_105]|uniref:diadenylate cyclase n=1 Tax=Paeniglutamicibacter sp. ORCA_105 TaxID=3377336 RepID=UPI0038957AC0